MAVLSWGKPTIEIQKIVNGVFDENKPWTALPEIKQGTAKVSVQKGNRIEALAEGGDVVDVRVEKSKYSLECEIFVKKGDVRIIEDTDGVIIDNYAVRLIPEDTETEGFLLANTAVSVEESWSSADGKILKYTFDALKPASGKICQPYKKKK